MQWFSDKTLLEFFKKVNPMGKYVGIFVSTQLQHAKAHLSRSVQLSYGLVHFAMLRHSSEQKQFEFS